MIKTYKIEVYRQDVNLEKFNINCGVKRFIYNFYITVNKERYERGESFLSYMSFEKWMNNEFLPNNEEYKWIKQASQKNLKQGMKDANDAFKRFFKKEADFPRYKKRRDKVSFYFVNDNQIRLERHRVKIPIFGWLRIKEFGYLPEGKILSGNLVREANKFYVCLKSEEEVNIRGLGEQTEGIGIDLGLKELATVSNGMVFENINKTSKNIKLLENRKNHLQKELSRRLGKKLTKKKQEEKRKEKEEYKKWWKSLSKEEKTEIKKQKKLYKEGKLETAENKKIKMKEDANKKVNKNAIKTINALQVVYAKLNRIRQGYVRQVVNSLVKPNPQFIAIEDLNIQGLVKNKHLSKAILSCCWGYFIEYLTRQCEKYNIKLIKADRFYPSSKTCSNCGCKKIKLSLSERTFKCLNCGNEIDRDYNASLNLKYLGLTGEFTA